MCFLCALIFLISKNFSCSWNVLFLKIASCSFSWIQYLSYLCENIRDNTIFFFHSLPFRGPFCLFVLIAVHHFFMLSSNIWWSMSVFNIWEWHSEKVISVWGSPNSGLTVAWLGKAVSLNWAVCPERVLLIFCWDLIRVPVVIPGVQWDYESNCSVCKLSCNLSAGLWSSAVPGIP